MFRRPAVDVRVVGDSVEISQGRQLLRVQAVKHHPVKAYGALANPGKAGRINALVKPRGKVSSTYRSQSVARGTAI